MTDRYKNSQNQIGCPEADIPELDTATANKILNSVLERNNMTPTSIPVEVLKSWGNYNRNSFSISSRIVTVLIILTLLLPLTVFKPGIIAERTNVGDSQGRIASYEVNIRSVLPVSSVIATLDGEELAVSKDSSREYTLDVPDNGELIITARSINGQVTSRKYKVNYLDTEKPEYVDSRYSEDSIFITLSDTYSGIDWNSIEGVTPLSVDKDNCEIQISRPSEPVTIKVSDMAGNTLELRVSP